MIDPVRQEIVALAKTLVIKVGSSVLAAADGTLNHDRLRALAEQIHRIRQTGRRVALVSSGAIAAGIGRLGLRHRPTDLPQLQAAAAVGQSCLVDGYEACFRRHGYHTAQILLTAEDFDNRGRYLNARNTLLTLFAWNCVPIINENDTVSVAEIRFSDNDHLAAMVTNLLQAQLLVMLTSVDGLYAGDPSSGSAEPLKTVTAIDDSIVRLAGDGQTPLGTGGMASKLRAARLVTSAGEAVIVANGKKDGILDAILAGEDIGTLFLPHGGVLRARQRWIGLTAQPRGKIVVDAGARRAVLERGSSLLAIGIVDAEGSFAKGDIVAIVDDEHREFARGLTNYAVTDVRRIKGLRTPDIVRLLGPATYGEVVHRDNLVRTA